MICFNSGECVKLDKELKVDTIKMYYHISIAFAMNIFPSANNDV